MSNPVQRRGRSGSQYLIATLACAFLLGLGYFSHPRIAAYSSASAEQAVREVLEQQKHAWNKADLDGFMSTYQMSDDITFYGSAISKGWVAIKERYEKRYKAPGAEMGKLEFDNLLTDTLSPDAVMVRGQWKLTLRDQTNTGYFTLLVRKRPEGWKIVHDHTSEAKPAP